MNHKEAFCEMLYHCKKCEYVTTFWNSRDGVTAFCTTCVLPECGGDMCHDWFRDDRLSPTIPPKASHVWISMTMERAKEKEAIFWKHNGEAMMAVYPHLAKIGEKELRKSKLDEIYHEGETPDLITRSSWLQHKHITGT